MATSSRTATRSRRTTCCRAARRSRWTSTRRAASDDRRIGFAIRYIATSVKQLAGERDGAMLVRGVDDFHHFAPERPPAYDLAPEARAHHAEAMARSGKILDR